MRKLSDHLVEDHQDERVVIVRNTLADICRSYDALNIHKPSVKAHTFVPSIGRQSHVDLCESEASLVYIVSIIKVPGQPGLCRENLSKKNLNCLL